jgi:hypothetical protein
MFRPQDIKERLREKPFRPFRIIADEGLRYDIRHPDLVLVGQHDVVIGHPGASDPAIYDRLVRVALVHVVALEEVSPASSNGPAQQ